LARSFNRKQYNFLTPTNPLTQSDITGKRKRVYGLLSDIYMLIIR